MLELIVGTLLGAVALLYFYFTHIYGYWSRKGVVQAPTIFGFGNLYDAFFMKKHTGIIYDDIYKLYSEHDAVGIYGFATPKLLLRNPELIKKVAVTEFSSFHDNEFYVNEKADPLVAMDPFVIRGEEWKPVRSKLVSTLTPGRMKEIYPLMRNIIPRLHSYLNDNLDKDIEVKELASLFTMDNVSDTVFGITSNCFQDANAPFRKFGDILMKEQLQGWRAMILILLPKVRELLGIKLLPTAVCNYLEEAVHKVLTYRQKHNVSRNDLFQYVMKKESGNFKELLIIGATFFIEGFETAAIVSSYTLYELALNPQVQQKLYEEVEKMYEDSEDPDYDTVMNLSYLDNVLQETQRKYPVLKFFSRICTKPCQLDVDGKSIKIETGTPMIIPAFSVQRDPAYYPDPEVFDPERFNEENKAARPACTYIPFGEGPRICPGQRFGLIQVKLFILSIVHKFRILKTEKTPEKITFSPETFLTTPKEELLVRFSKRN